MIKPIELAVRVDGEWESLGCFGTYAEAHLHAEMHARGRCLMYGIERHQAGGFVHNVFLNSDNLPYRADQPS